MGVTAQVFNYIKNINFWFIKDINECTLINGGCSQTCTNIAGSYICSCIFGYFLDVDEHNCTGQWHVLIMNYLILSYIFRY